MTSVTSSPSAPDCAPLDLAPRLTAVAVDPPFTLVGTFETGEVRRLDLSGHVGRGPLAPPADPSEFAAAALEPGGFGVSWPTGCDLHRDSLYVGGEPVPVPSGR